MRFRDGIYIKKLPSVESHIRRIPLYAVSKIEGFDYIHSGNG